MSNLGSRLIFFSPPHTDSPSNEACLALEEDDERMKYRWQLSNYVPCGWLHYPGTPSLWQVGGRTGDELSVGWIIPSSPQYSFQQKFYQDNYFSFIVDLNFLRTNVCDFFSITLSFWWHSVIMSKSIKFTVVLISGVSGFLCQMKQFSVPAHATFVVLVLSFFT